MMMKSLLYLQIPLNQGLTTKPSTEHLSAVQEKHSAEA